MTLDRRCFLAVSAAAAALPSVAGAQSGWTRRAPMPWVAQEIYCAARDGQVVVAGGLVRNAVGQTHINDRTALYDVAADRWSEGPRLPQPRHHPMLVATDRWVFAFGGYDRREGGEWTSMTDVWALGDEGWQVVGQMPGPLAETVGLHLDNRVHLVTGRSPAGEANGGWNDQADVDTHLVYLTGENRWETARPAPMARNSAAGAVQGGALYVAGGRTVTGGGTGRLDRYDPASDRWDTLAPIPASDTGQQVGGGLAMAAVGERLVAFGGEWFARPGGGVFSETWIYDIARDAWTRGPDMATPRHGLAACAVGGTVLAIAGGEVVSGGKASAVVEALSIQP